MQTKPTKGKPQYVCILFIINKQNKQQTNLINKQINIAHRPAKSCLVAFPSLPAFVRLRSVSVFAQRRSANRCRAGRVCTRKSRRAGAGQRRTGAPAHQREWNDAQTQYATQIRNKKTYPEQTSGRQPAHVGLPGVVTRHKGAVFNHVDAADQIGIVKPQRISQQRSRGRARGRRAENITGQHRRCCCLLCCWCGC